MKAVFAYEIRKKEILLEERTKLRSEVKVAKKIAAIAAEKLGMTYPKQEQTILLKGPGHTKKMNN